MKTVPESPPVPDLSVVRTVVFAAIIFVIAHFAMLIGITTPEKFYFDEVHYVPAARQMLEPVMREPMLNPMHPPLAKQLIAWSIHSFGDDAAGVALSGGAVRRARHRRGVSVRPGAVRGAGACDRGKPARVFQPDGVRAIAHRDAGYFRADPRPVRYCFVPAWLSAERPHFWFALVGLFSGLSIACKWSGLFVLAVCIVIVAAIRLMQGWRTQFADGNEDDWYRPDLWPTFKAWHFAACFLLIPSLAYLSDLRPALRPVGAGYTGGTAPDLRRQHHDRDRGPHLYEFVAVLAVPDTPGLVSL